MSKEIVSQGESWTVVQDDRSYLAGTSQKSALHVSGTTGKVIIGGTTNGQYGTGALAVTGGSTALSGASFVSAVVTGLSAAGSITLAGALVGDVVVIANNMSTPATANSLFEATISVAGHIQQLTSTDESAAKFSILLAHQ